MKNKILIISIEGKESYTEEKFYNIFIDRYPNQINFMAFNHQTDTNKIVSNIEKRVAPFLDKKITYSEDEEIYWNIFIIHDGDEQKDKPSINKTFLCFEEYFKNQESDNTKIEYCVKRIFDEKESFDIFLFKLWNKFDQKKYASFNSFKKYIKDSHYKKRYATNLQDDFYRLFTADSKIIEILNKIIIAKLDSKHIEIINKILEISNICQ